LFARDPDCQQLLWQLDQPPTEALLSGLLVSTEVAGEYRCERTLFWQLPQPWLGTSLTGSYPQQMVISHGKRHPLRPAKPRGEVYRRFDARLGAWISCVRWRSSRIWRVSIAGRTARESPVSGRRRAASSSIANT
jgi:hypothetical protein